MVKCKNCGEEIEEKNFCPKCGTKNDIILCPSCNSQLEEEDIFCPECGEKIKDDEELKEESSDNEEEKTPDEKPEDEEQEEEKTPDEKHDETKETSKKESRICPHCNAKIDEEDAEYCLECGNPINIDAQSFNGIKYTIKTKKLIIFSIISIVFSIGLSLLLSFVFGMMGQNIDLYPVGFFISLFVVIAIFGSFKDLLNGGLLGIITGLVVGLLCNFIVELSSGFAFSYQMFSGYAAIVFTIFGAIVGVISTKYFRKSVSNHIDVEKLF